MPKKVKVGVIGLGNMGRHHANHYASIPMAELVAVCDINPDLVNQFSAQHRCRGYSDLTAMLASESLDAVSIIAPTQLHYALAKQVMMQGVSVLVEKPIAETVAQADELIALAKQQQVVLTVGHIERFNPAVMALKACLPDIGDLITIHTKRAAVFPSQIRDANVMIDLAVHDIDIISWLFGTQPVKVERISGGAFLKNREDYTTLLLNYGGDLFPKTGIVEVNWITPKRVRQLVLTGTKGYVELDYLNQTLTVYPTQVSAVSEEVDHLKMEFSTPQLISIEKKPPLDAELTHFLTCVQQRLTPIVTGEDAREALRLALSGGL